jgi:gamma-glutamylcyclotransferase (GGCT)/AIG2-like uncharacterized protein YtfP
MSTHVFAYGSNLDPARMVDRVPSARVVGRSELSGHELRFHKRGWQDGTGKANAFGPVDGGAVVHGVIYEVAEDDLAALDVHETGYERRLLSFDVDGLSANGSVEAWVYLATPAVIDDSLLPTPWYLHHVVTGAKAHGLPGELLDWLQRHPTER